MKTKSIFILTIAVFFLMTGCRYMNTGDSITGSSNYITRDFKVAHFDRLNLATVADVYYTQSADDSWTLKVYGPDNIVELVGVDVKDNTLILNMKKKNVKKSNLKITISTPNLKEVKTSGVGNFNIQEKFEAADLAIANEGVGNIKISDIRCTNLDIDSDGVGNISVKGEAEAVSLSANGVGNINADELMSQHATARSNGVGNISCYAKQSIDASANGVGNISYKGNPAEKQIKKNGIGNIKQR
jgi:Protein of unknown function (DUF2807).